MPRKPTRRRRLLPPSAQPLTFSPFCRSIARLSSALMIKRVKNSSHSSLDDGLMKNHYEEKSDRAESSDGEESEGTVLADFAFFDPKPDDFHGVKILLQNYLDNKEWDLSGFVDLILGQPTVGTVVKIEGSEDEGLFAVISALNLGRYKSHKCIAELKDFLLKACKEKDVVSNLKSLLGDQARNVGLLVSRRVFNLPSPLLPPLYNALFDEVSWATEDEPMEELRSSFRFKAYLLITKFYKHKNGGKKGRPNSGKKGRPSVQDDEAIIYVKPEDEIFHKLSLWSFEFPLHSQPVAATELKNYQATGLVMAVEADKIAAFRQQLRSLVDYSDSI